MDWIIKVTKLGYHSIQKTGQNLDLDIQEMKQMLEIDLLGVARIDDSAPKEIRDCADSLLPGAKSAVVFGKEIYKELVDLVKPSKEVGEAEPGALLKPHYGYLNGRMTKATYDLSNILRNKGYHTLPLPPADCPTDQKTLIAIFPYKHAAVAAGLGTIGRNGLLITQEFGPRVRLACLLTDAPLEPTPVPEEKYCKDCQACIRICPAQALQPPEEGQFYSMNKFACQTYRNTGLTCSMCIKVCDSMRN
jgi:epoxyqueuosine reductase QueG